jgi:5-methylcytosine-specific restriction endonuclease McrA
VGAPTPTGTDPHPPMGAWDKGSTRRWRRIRAAILAENQHTHDGRCQLAIANVCTGQADCVHHVLGRAVTGDDRRYLVAACRACNLSVGEPDETIAPRKISRW